MPHHDETVAKLMAARNQMIAGMILASSGNANANELGSLIDKVFAFVAVVLWTAENGGFTDEQLELMDDIL